MPRVPNGESFPYPQMWFHGWFHDAFFSILCYRHLIFGCFESPSLVYVFSTQQDFQYTFFMYTGLRANITRPTHTSIDGERTRTWTYRIIFLALKLHYKGSFCALSQ